MPIARVAGTGFNSGVTETSSAIDTTGATLIVIHLAKLRTRNTPTLSDNKGNSWTTHLTARDAGNLAWSRLSYVVAPNVGSGHTFTCTESGGDPYRGPVSIIAFSGTHASDPFNKESGNIIDLDSGPVSAHTLPTITPDQDGSVIVTGICTGDDDVHSNHQINGGFTVEHSSNWILNQTQGGGLAYLIQTTAAAAAPQWSWTNTAVDTAATIAVFKPAGGGGGGGDAFMGQICLDRVRGY